MLRVDDLQDDGLPGSDHGTIRVMDGAAVVRSYDYFDWAQRGAAVIMAREFIAGRQSAAQEAR